jgi:hypothetical protein
MKNDLNFVLKHTLQEVNVCANILGKIGDNCLDSLIMVNKKFPDLSLVLPTDVQGVSFIKT